MPLVEEEEGHGRGMWVVGVGGWGWGGAECVGKGLRVKPRIHHRCGESLATAVPLVSDRTRAGAQP